MIRKVLQATDPQLRQKSKPVKRVDKKVLALVKDLKDTIRAQTDPLGIGLAAPQIGIFKRVFVIMPEKTIKVYINPEIIEIEKLPKLPKSPKHSKSKKTQIHKGKSAKSNKKSGLSADKKIMEGCLSIPHYYGPLSRPQKLKVKYLNTKGAEVIEELEGLPAQIIQHEIDHLNGALFIDRLLEQKEKLFEYIDGEWEEVDLII